MSEIPADQYTSGRIFVKGGDTKAAALASLNHASRNVTAVGHGRKRKRGLVAGGGAAENLDPERIMSMVRHSMDAPDALVLDDGCNGE